MKKTTTKNLTNMERRRLLDAAKKIYTHMMVQIKGYRRLVQKARNERIKQLLIRISDEEEKHAQFWSERINELGGKSEGTFRTYFRDRKVRLMMNVLGMKGLFEWTV
ncbi:MAG: hypothetical protein GTO54_12185, partial [Nitrososphaeria archaeon]|nr:hypothetical protein [Nitrososphaeria archaeon]